MDIVQGAPLGSVQAVVRGGNDGGLSGVGNGGGAAFRDIVAALREPDPLGIRALAEQREQLIRGVAISPRELIAYQIRAGEFGLQVELVSKIADGVLSTARRLQNSQ